MLYQQRLIQALFNQANKPFAQSSIDFSHPALAVYSNNYVESGIRALSITYRTVYGLIDKSNFRKLAAAYLNAYPKVCFDWADYGENLGEFIFEIEELANMPYLPEIAEMDWRLMHIERARNETFDGASFNLMQTFSTEQLCFKAAPGLQIMQVLFPVQELFQLVHNTKNNEGSKLIQDNSTQQADTINNLLSDAIKLGEYRSIVLWREEYKGLFEYSNVESTNAFESILNDKCIAEVLSHFGEDQNAMTNWLQRHIQSKKIYAVVKR